MNLNAKAKPNHILKSALIKGVISMSKAKSMILRAEPTTTRAESIEALRKHRH